MEATLLKSINRMNITSAVTEAFILIQGDKKWSKFRYIFNVT